MRVRAGWSGALALVALIACRPDPPPPTPATPRIETPATHTAPPAETGVLDLPGAEPFDLATRGQLTAALDRRDTSRPPRTRHLRADGSPRYVNRLALASSPYLLQHAHNPVNWYPWGQEAFEAARRLDRPIFLSVGYSTCHWCHVMEEESFEDEAIAEILNKSFVAIKVDREQRPDVDNLYMQAVYAMRGSGGWPMTVVMTPDRQPFFGATYLPPRAGVRGSRAGLAETLVEIADRYAADPKGVVAQAQRLSQTIARQVQPPRSDSLPGKAALDAAIDQTRRQFDPVHGGLGNRQKFPMPSLWRLLLRHHRRSPSPETLEMVTTTLDGMARGGIRDHVGGGFHRYTVEATWTIPHFEKMLYDNAQLVLLYLEAAQASGDPRYETVADEILRYVAREMTGDDGTFFAATDADSPGGEGAFFTWTPNELRAALGDQDGALAAAWFAVHPDGNLEGRTVLTTATPLDRFALDHHIPEADLPPRLAHITDALYTARARRPPPSRDEKVLAGWNGLMISAFARAARQLARPDLLTIATRAADRLLAICRIEGRLRRGHVGGVPMRELGFLDDYAAVIGALLDLFEATGSPRWLEDALDLQTVLDTTFADPVGGYFLESTEHEALLARQKPADDGAIPSGNALAAHNLLRLAELTTDTTFKDRAEALFKAFSLVLQQAPTAMPHLLAAVEASLDEPWEIVLVADTPQGHAPFLDALARIYLPNHVLIPLTTGPQAQDVAALSPHAEWKPLVGAKPTAYLCQRGTCQRPTTDPASLATTLRTVKALDATTP